MIERVDIGVVQPAAVIERILDELEARHAHRLHEDMVGAAGAAHHDMVRPHRRERRQPFAEDRHHRSEEHTSELQSLMRISYAVFCLKKKKQQTNHLLNQQIRYTITRTTILST